MPSGDCKQKKISQVKILIQIYMEVWFIHEIDVCYSISHQLDCPKQARKIEEQLEPLKLSAWLCKVEKILKGRLDLIPSPSPSVKSQIMGRKVCLRCKAKDCWGLSTNFWKQKVENKKFVDINQQCFALLSQVNFPANNLNFHWRWRRWDRIRLSS